MEIKPGAIGLLKFPNTDLNPGKLRPVLVVKKASGKQGRFNYLCHNFSIELL